MIHSLPRNSRNREQSVINRKYDVPPQAVVEFARNLYSFLAKKFGGDTTLNELRIMNQIILCHIKGRCCSVTALHKATGIPIPTVSRSVAHLQYSGYLTDRRDPSDGRKRIISIDSRAFEQTSGDIDDMIQWINDFREHGLPN